MKRIKALLKNSIFKNMLIAFIIIIIPLYTITAGVYIWAVNTVGEEIKNSMISNLSFYINNLEAEILRIKILQDSCLSDINLNRIANNSEIMSDYERTYSILNLQQRLNAIKSSSNYIKEATVYIPSINRSISAAGGVNEINVDKLTRLIQMYSSKLNTVYWRDGIYLLSTLPFNINKDINLVFMIEIELEEYKLKNALAQFNANNGSGALLFNLSENYILSGSVNHIIAAMGEQLRLDAIGPDFGTNIVKVGGINYFTVYKKSQYLDILLQRFIPESEVYEKVKIFKIWLWFFPFAALLVIIAFSIFVLKYVQQPLKKLINSFYRVESGDFNFKIEHTRNNEFRDLYNRFNLMVEKTGALIEQVYKQKILAQRAQLKQLQSQINPHFLYNSFFILYRMAKGENYEKVVSFAEQLGEYFQYITRSAAEEVPFTEEVKHAKVYTEIQMIRFSNRIKVEFDELPDQIKEVHVPRLIIQPILENAFKYGLENKAAKGMLRVAFCMTNELFSIVIEDNGNGLNESELMDIKKRLSFNDDMVEQTGIINIHRRLQLKFGLNSGVVVSKSEMGGLKVCININKGKGENNVQAFNS